MNWDQFKDLPCYLCISGAEVACSSLTQEVAGLNTVIFFFLKKCTKTEFMKKNLNACLFLQLAN